MKSLFELPALGPGPAIETMMIWERSIPVEGKILELKMLRTKAEIYPPILLLCGTIDGHSRYANFQEGHNTNLTIPLIAPSIPDLEVIRVSIKHWQFDYALLTVEWCVNTDCRVVYSGWVDFDHGA